MLELSQDVLDEAAHEASTLTVDRFLMLVEQHHADAGAPGVPRDAFEAYVRALAERRDLAVDLEGMLEEFDRRVTDSREWVGTEAFYDLGDGRVSRFPTAWHEHLGGSADLPAYVQFFEEEVPEFKRDLFRGGPGGGIAEQALLDVVMVVGGLDRGEAKEHLDAARQEGVIEERTSQHPESKVRMEDEDADEDDRLV